MFEKERFVEDCRAALKERDTHSAIRELVAAVVTTPSEIVRVLGEPKRAGVETLYRANDLTILNLCWGPYMSSVSMAAASTILSIAVPSAE